MVSHSVYSVRDVFIWSNSVQTWVEKGAVYFKTIFKKWSARGQPWVTRGSARVHQGVSQGSPGGQPRVSQGSPGGQPGVSQGSSRGQPGVN